MFVLQSSKIKLASRKTSQASPELVEGLLVNLVSKIQTHEVQESRYTEGGLMGSCHQQWDLSLQLYFNRKTPGVLHLMG